MESSDQFIYFFCRSLSDEYGCPCSTCELCGNDAHYGYDCPLQVPFVYNQDLCFNQNLDNIPQTSPSFLQQFLCCEDCGGPPATFECQPMNHSTSSDLQTLGKTSNQLKQEEQVAKICTPYWKCHIFNDDDNEKYTIQVREYYKNSPVAITPDLPITNSLVMKDEHLNTISETDYDEEIESSVKNLNPTPSESEDLFDYVSECDLPFCDNSLAFNNDSEIFSNPLFDSNADYTSSDDESFSEEDVPVENFKIYSNPLLEFDEEIFSKSLLNKDTVITSPKIDFLESLLNKDTVITSPKIDFLLEEFAGELALINPIPPGIAEPNFDPEGDISLVDKLLYDNSSPRPPEELNSEISDAIIKSFSPSPIPVEDSDSLMEEIDIFLAPDDSIPPGIENDDYDSDGDILFLKELLSNDSLLLLENESFHFDRYYVPSFPRPPEKPPDDDGSYFDIEPDMGVLTAKAFNHDYPDYEDSRARGFVQRSLDLHSFACLFWESYILDLID
ncbi:hypothetical protein Tco_0626101 [Tanacetum coccineum]|uniref:Uncharacterized protein n=1 Tax=Tanacetum coccineum TaxID=301880 RepID=A0ABQ4WIT1_9ASTR